MIVRAKFWVERIDDFNEGKAITLRAVYDGSAENKEFFKATPAGLINLSTVNPSAAQVFERGKEYYVDFTKADEGAK